MPSEIVMCIDMNGRYRDSFEGVRGDNEGAYDTACAEATRFCQYMEARGIPAWFMLFTDKLKLGKTILTQDTPADVYHAALKQFDETEVGGLGGIPIPPGSYVQMKCTSSGFDNAGLYQELKKQGVRKIYMFGYAAGDCVAATAIDAMKHGFEVEIVQGLAYDDKSIHELTAVPQSTSEIRGLLQARFIKMLSVPHTALPNMRDDLFEVLDRKLKGNDHSAQEPLIQLFRLRTNAWNLYRVKKSFIAAHAYSLMRARKHPDATLWERVTISDREDILSRYPAVADQLLPSSARTQDLH